MNEKMKPYYERYDKAFETNDIMQLAYLNQFANDVDIRKWNREQMVIAMAEKDGVDVSREKHFFKYKRLKGNHPDCVLLFSDDVGYYAYLDDADVLNKVLDCPLLDWDGMKAAGFPRNALDIMLPRLVRAKYRVAVCDELEDPKKKRKPIVIEPPKPTRKEPIQLSLFD